MLSQSGAVLLLNATFVGNQAGTGGAGGRGGRGADGSSPGSGAAGGNGGNGGNGGALRRQLTGTAFLTHGTAMTNRAGAGGTAGSGGSGGSGSGGSTGSTGPSGTGGLAGAGGAVSDGSGVNAYFTQVTNSILASNTPANCAGNIENGGRNLAFGDVSASCAGFTVADPLLGPLQDNGGAVDTMAPLAGSPAIDQVPAAAAACPAADARGVARPVPAGGTCDIGAVEISAPSCQPVSAPAVAGQPTVITLTCTDAAGAPFTYAVTSQPAHGTLSGLDSAAGRVTYTADAGFAGPDGFGFQVTTADGTASATVTLTVTAPPTVPAPGPAPDASPGTGPSPGPTPSPAPGGTTRAPVLSLLRIAPGMFRAARRGASARPAATATSARVTFRLDRAATVRFKVARRVAGRRSGSRCVTPTSRNRRARSCTRLVSVKGSFSRTGRAGSNAFRFTGRIGGRRLAPGRYVLRAAPRASALTGAVVSVSFRIVR